jgi:hypothetical protein
MGGCGCSKSSKNSFKKSSNILSESILEGEFTRVDGYKFNMSMSATGAGSDCKIAKNSSKYNIFQTLKNFLEVCNPKIIDYKYVIKTNCYLKPE